MRAPWSRLTRRTFTLGGVAAASAAFATVAMAAGPVIYSEYTSSDDGSGDRESRVVEGDGTNDAPFTKDAYAATVSPDGRRIAQVAVVRGAGTDDEAGFHSALRVTAADGSSPVEVLAHEIGPEAETGRVVVGVPVWSPDGTQVLVEEADLADREGRRTDRVLCTVASRSCRPVGRRTYVGRAVDSETLSTDVVAWPAGAGPLRSLLPGPRTVTPGADRRCGARAVVTRGPAARVTALYRPNAFGPTATLPGLPFDSDLTAVDPGTAGLVAVRDGVLAHDAPAARVRQGTVRCRKRGGRTWRTAATLGLPRLTVRRAGATTTLPTPAGLLRGDLVQLVPTDDGGAILLTRGRPAEPNLDVECPRRPSVESGCAAYPRFVGSSGSAKPRAQRVWRYRPGASALEPVTGLRRGALNALRDADDVAQGTGDALLAVDDRGIDRVPLDGGAPTAIARGRDITLGLATPDGD